MPAQISEIWIYPVKALRGIPVSRATLEPWGLRDDRRWIVMRPDGTMLTQRELPSLATIVATPTADGLTLSAPACAPCAVIRPGSPAVTVVVWRQPVPVMDAGDAVADWLSAVLGEPARLAFQADPTLRTVDPGYATDADRVSLADGFPLLVTTDASLAALNAALAAPVPMTRFRPNLVVSGTAAWDEDGWHHLSIGGISFRGPKTCERCTVTTVDQETGTRPARTEPLKTLGHLHRDGRGRIVFGMNLIPDGTGEIAVGDPVVIG